MKIHAVETGNDLQNIFYVLEYGKKQAIVIDPPETQICKNFLDNHDLQLEKVFITHEHFDHYSGVEGLGCSAIYASKIASTHIPFHISHIVNEADILFEENGYVIGCFSTPGHADGHMTFELSYDGKPLALFVGDTIFPGGVGHVRGGNIDDLYDSIQKFQHYQDDVTIYSGHDYLENNYAFIKKYFPEKAQLCDEVLQKKAENIYFTHLGQERSINPFLSCDREEFTKIRELRNTW